MKKIDYSKVTGVADHLAELAESGDYNLFPGLLSDSEMEEIQRRRVKAKPKGKVATVREDEYIIKGGGVSDDGEVVDDFDIARYMAEAEDKETGVLHDLKIDTRDMRAAKNFYDYAFNMQSAKANPPWSRQMWVGLMLFGEVCPRCSDHDWLDIHNVPVDFKAKDMPDRLQLLEFGKCPRCGSDKWDLIQNHGLRNYMQYVGVIGQRGSKSSLTALLSSYSLHRFVKFPNYASLSKSMQASTELTGTFVSLTFAKAVGVLWTPFKKIIEESDWWKGLFDILKHHGNQMGTELYTMSSLYLTLGYKNIRFYPSGPKSSTLRGDTRILAALDELGLFPLPTGDSEEDETSERANSDEAHKSLYNSLGTVSVTYENLLKEGVSSAPPPLLFNVSSPYSQRDKMMRLLREARTPDGEKVMLGVNLATWEMNPFYTRNSQIIAQAYAANPEKAARDWGASPPAVHSRFIHPDTVGEGVFVGGPNAHNFIYQFDKPGEVYGRIERVRGNQWPSIIAIDAGSSNNSFCIAAVHYNFETGKTVVGTALECIPMNGKKVNFNLLYLNVILKLARETNAVGMVADQWQSIDLLQRIREDMGLNPLGKPRCLPRQYSPRRKDFDACRAMLTSKNLILPTITESDRDRIVAGGIDDYRSEFMNRPVPHILHQMITVRDVGPEKCPEKGEGYTDDMFRAIVLGSTIVHHPRVMERLAEARNFNYGGDNGNRMPEPGFAGRSGGFGARR
ncbi:terminase [Burkholderia phage BcepSauron]|uniref:Terminase n=1 Tax=Burkholderia phage BcepSauron TaxID=2530033 RepID=A0A482MLU9_9CAUD|nr:terminase large subunit [Burkholderia phage BcepSauron]QBQ74625.1 terminase [Burkholderia phage BcepSauron]